MALEHVRGRARVISRPSAGAGTFWDQTWTLRLATTPARPIMQHKNRWRGLGWPGTSAHPYATKAGAQCWRQARGRPRTAARVLPVARRCPCAWAGRVGKADTPCISMVVKRPRVSVVHVSFVQTGRGTICAQKLGACAEAAGTVGSARGMRTCEWAGVMPPNAARTILFPPSCHHVFSWRVCAGQGCPPGHASDATRHTARHHNCQ
jgi:hypothetical protein